ncbi:hypothetical protein [Candidatus Cryosericum septentrionale]|jgi:hypothetical protein|uniref:Uncharacterized protein n=1 Tax=Candidatus Cryosericum septentrionale TaxID=2290913 RepID=A0A398DTV5_9BACT|nr:hypothetical protein [Candidatus Cryosericum septentrionale]RIE15598.1 hypothetical protein SMC1_09825 [Candidatus Cryosericum septentrionale]
MRGFRRPKKKAIFLAVAVLVLAVSVFIVARNLNSNGTPGTPSTTPGTTAKPSKNDIGLYLDKGDLWQWVSGRKTQLTKLGTIVTFDWHPAGGELVYVTSEADGSYKAVDRKLASKQELVIYQGKTEMWPKVLCSSNGVLLVEASPTTTPRLLQLTITSVGYDSTTNGSFWTQVPLTKEQFDRTTRLILGGSTPLIVSPGGIWTIAASSLGFDTAHTFLGPTGVTFADGTFFGPMQDTKGTFLGIKTKGGKVTNVTSSPSSTGILPPFVRGASRTTDGKTLVYELGIYGPGTGADGKTAPLTYETWQYVEGSRKPKLVVKGNAPSLFAYQFTGGSAPVASGKQPGATLTTETGLMFRDQPITIGSTVLEVAAPTETRTALGLGQGWVQAKGLGQAKGKTGWVYGGYARITRGSTTYAPFAKVTASTSVKVYLDESLSGTATTVLAKGDNAVALGMTADKRAIQILLPSGTKAFVATGSVTVSN